MSWYGIKMTIRNKMKCIRQERVQECWKDINNIVQQHVIHKPNQLKLFNLAFKIITFILQSNLAYKYNHKQDFNSWILIFYWSYLLKIALFSKQYSYYEFPTLFLLINHVITVNFNLFSNYWYFYISLIP